MLSVKESVVGGGGGDGMCVVMCGFWGVKKEGGE